MAKTKISYLKLVVISPIMTQANVKPFFNIVDIFSCFLDKISVIASTGGNVFIDGCNKSNIYHVSSISPKNKVVKIFNYLLVQMKVAVQLIRRDFDISFFYMGDGFLLPILIVKTLKKKVVLILGGSAEEALNLNYVALYKIIILFKEINLKLSDRIIVYSPLLIKKWNLEKYSDKILIAHEHFINFDDFTIETKYENRECIIGYIGCLSEIKGVLKFVESIPKIISINKSIKIIIGGSGPLNEKIQDHIINNDLSNFVEFVGWINHDELGKTLNRFKLLVMPSHTEGLPNIMLEAMACGTPVLATNVGAILDIIKDGKTGFIMENNSPACIAENIMRALDDPDLETIVENAKAFVELEFSYEATVKRWKEIMEEL